MTRRIQVRISPEFDSVLDEYIAVSGRNRSDTCAEFLNVTIPVLKAMIETLRDADNVVETASVEFKQILDDAVEDANQFKLELVKASKGRHCD